MNPRRLILFFLGLLTALRLVLIGQFELFPDESYYFMWSERMDWSFFSKGPGVAAAMWLSTHLFGVSEFGIRFFSPLLALGTSLVLWNFARRLYGESVAAWTVLLMNSLPIFHAGALVMTIDPLSIFFWAAALATCWRALEESPAFSWWWPATGALIGLGFLSKYTNAMQLLSIALLLALTAKYRAEFKRPGFYVMLGVFLVCCTPVLIWNAQHEWVTLDHLVARGGLKKPFSLNFGELGKFLLMHFGVFSPLIFGGMIAATVWAWPKAKHSFKVRYLLAFTLPLFALYFWLSLKQAGEPNWTAPAVISLGVLTAALWHERAETSRGARRFALAALAVGVAMSLFILNTDLVRLAGVPWSYERDPSARMRGWQSAAGEVERLRAEFETQLGQPVFLIANEHEVAASLAFYLKDKRPEGPGHPPIYIPAQPYFEDQFSFWHRYDELIDLPAGFQREDTIFTEEQGYNPFRGRSALYITDRVEKRTPASIKAGFERWMMTAHIDQARRGQPLRQLRVFACTNYLDPGVK
jgi:hypothetical protein